MTTRSNIFTCASVLALVCAAASGQGVQVVKPVHPGTLQLVGTVQCPPGFVASPAKIDPTKKYGQSYTCTGPVAACMNGFGMVAPVVGYGPVPAGGIMGTPYYGSPVTLTPGKQMTFTCQQPSAPPK